MESMTDEKGYSSVMVATRSDIRGFGITAKDSNGVPKQQELVLNKGITVIRVPANSVDAFIAGLTDYAKHDLISIKILKPKNAKK